MLAVIAQWVPHYLCHEIPEESMSVAIVWYCIRQYYNLEQNEVQFINVTDIKWEGADKERTQHLYRRILSNVKDNLLKADSPLQYNKANQTQNEDISPTVDCLVVLHWIELIDPTAATTIINRTTQ